MRLVTALAAAALLAACASPTSPISADAPRSGAPGDVVGRTWAWQQTVTPVEQFGPGDPLRYSVTFATNGRVGIQADCNRGSAPFEMDVGKVAIKSIALTRAICPEPAHADRFVRDLGRVTSFFVMNGQLFMEMPMDSGTLRFSPAR
jgi:heat shock protein HslJ